MAENRINEDFTELLDVIADHRALSKMDPLKRSEAISDAAERIESYQTPLEIPGLNEVFENVDGLVWYFPEVLTHLVLNGMEPEQIAKLSTFCRPATRDAFEQRLPLMKSPNATRVQVELARKKALRATQPTKVETQPEVPADSKPRKVLVIV